MKEVGLIVDLYLSSVLDKEVVKRAVSDFYSPLIRLLKVNKDLKISLNIPLSTLELLDKHGYEDLISDIKDLHEKEKIEIVGASPYNSLLTNFSKEFSESQIILNEYGLGYYLGSKQGFEGESSIMLKGLDGFIPTELVVNEDLLSTLGDMGYRWVAVNSSQVSHPEDPTTALFNGTLNGDLVVVGVIDNLLEEDEIDNGEDSANKNVISRDLYVKKIDKILGLEDKSVSSIYEHSKKDSIVFKIGSNVDSGLQNSFKKEYEVIEILIEHLIERKLRIELVKDLVRKERRDLQKFETKPKDSKVKYYDKKDEESSFLIELERSLVEGATNNDKITDDEELSTISMWKDDEVSKITDTVMYSKVRKFILLSKFVCIDKFYYLRYVFDKSDSFSHASTRLNIIMDYARGLIDFIDDISTKEKCQKLLTDFSTSLKL